MKLTKEQKAYGARLSMAMMLFADINEHKYETVQMLCETFNLSNEKVVKKMRHHNRIILSIPSEQIYYDWLYVIFDESENNENILNEFYSLSQKRFPQIKSIAEKVEEYFSKNQLSKCNDIINMTEKQDIQIDCLFFICFIQI